MLLHLQAVGRQFDAPQIHRVLADINLDLCSGEFLCLVGSSGSGKTTLLRIIAGLDEADLGNRSFPVGRPRMAMVFQEPRLAPWLTILENMLLVTDQGASKHAIEMLRQAELQDCIDRYPGQLSGGMQRRVALVRALLVEPELLLLDEPLTSLDPALEGRMSDLLCQYWRQHRPAVIMVTHDPRQAALLATRVISLSAGVPGLVLDERLTMSEPGCRSDQERRDLVEHLIALCPTLATSPTNASSPD